MKSNIHNISSFLILRRYPSYNILTLCFHCNPLSINGIKVGTREIPTGRVVIEENHRRRSRRAFSSCSLSISFSQIAAERKKLVLVPYLVISFLDNALPRDVSDPFPYLHLPLVHLPCSLSCIFTRNILTGRVVLLGWFLLARVEASRCRGNILKREIFLLSRRTGVTNAPTTSITGVKTRNNGLPGYNFERRHFSKVSEIFRSFQRWIRVSFPHDSSCRITEVARICEFSSFSLHVRLFPFVCLISHSILGNRMK